MSEIMPRVHAAWVWHIDAAIVVLPVPVSPQRIAASFCPQPRATPMTAISWAAFKVRLIGGRAGGSSSPGV